MAAVELGEVQETLLATLYARAVETRKKSGVLRDDKALEMVESINYDFTKFDGSPMLFGSVLRTLILDHWVRRFLKRHPAGTVVEVGAGLNTRFERLDDHTMSWVDIDLPDSMALRDRFFQESSRRRMLAASILGDDWVGPVRESPGPYFFVIEGVLLYFRESQVKAALQRIAANFPGSYLAFDTATRKLVADQDRPVFKKQVRAGFQWSCDDPRQIAGLHLKDSRTLLQLPREIRARLPLPYRCLLPAARLVYGRAARVFTVNLFTTPAGDRQERGYPAARAGASTVRT